MNANWLVLVAIMAGGPSGDNTTRDAKVSKSVFVLPGGARVEIAEAPFEPKLNRIEGCGKDDELCLINGRPPFGVSFGLPKTYVQGITVSFMGRSYQLDVTDMYDAWGERSSKRGERRWFGGQCYKSSFCVFRGVFGDGGDTYVAEWSVYRGVVSRTVITDADDVVNVFMENIERPRLD